MSIHVIEKQYLLGEPLSADALHLARAIYNTYIEDDKDLYMEIHIEKIMEILHLSHTPQSISYIIDLLEEINEPLGVKNFKFFGQIYPLRFVVFCTYEIKDDLVIIELSEEFLHVEEEYMIDRFLIE